MEQSIPSKPVFQVGEFELDAHTGELRNRGLKTRLAEQPLQILLLLIEHHGEVVARDDLRERLWPADTFVDFDMGLNRAMRKLRDALGDSAEGPEYIETLPRRGYRLIAKVSEKPDSEPASPPARQRRTITWIAATAAVVTLGIMAVAGFHKAAPPRIRSIAVLPLANLSGDRAQEYFADGMTEALITDLAQLRDVRVISRTSVMPYKGSRKSLPEIARDLNVDGVLEGGVLRAGGRVRVTAQLILAATDHHLWARSYERNERDVVTLQRELAAAITEAIRGELTAEARARVHTAPQINAEAYDLFLKGMTSTGRENTQGFTDAIAYFNQAIEKQPDFAEAYVAVARCYTQFAYNGSVAPAESMPRAKAAVLKALAIDPELAEAHAEMGRLLYQYDWDWTRSEKEIRRALDLNPNDARTHRAYAALLRATGRFDEAKVSSRRAGDLDPLWVKTPAGVLGSAIAFRSAGNYRQAIAEMRRALQMDPALSRGHFQLGLTLAEAGMLNEAIVELETAIRLSQKNLRYRAGLGWAYGLAGRDAEARTILTELTTRSQREYVSPVAIALVHLGLNQNEAALRALEQAYQQRDFELLSVTRSMAFRPLRSEPRFRELMRRIGLPEASRISESRAHGSMRQTSPAPAEVPRTVM